MTQVALLGAIIFVLAYPSHCGVGAPRAEKRRDPRVPVRLHQLYYQLLRHPYHYLIHLHPPL